MIYGGKIVVVILGRFFRAEWVRASTSSRRVFAEYFKPMHTDKFASSQESRNQKIFYFVLSQINIHHNSRLSFKNICIRTLSPDRLSLRLLSSLMYLASVILLGGSYSGRASRRKAMKRGYSIIFCRPRAFAKPLGDGSFHWIQRSLDLSHFGTALLWPPPKWSMILSFGASSFSADL